MFENELLWGTLFLAIGFAHIAAPRTILGANAKIVLFGSVPEDREVGQRHIWLTRAMGGFFIGVGLWVLLLDGGPLL